MNPVLKRLTVAVRNMFGRASVSRTNDTTKLQLVQLEVLAGEVRDEVEHPQPYGFTSVPEEGAEAFVACVGGGRDHPVAIVIEDRRYRLRGLQSGEVALYHKSGSKVLLKANGDIEIVPSSGNVVVTGTLTASVDVVGGGKSLKNHTHGPGTFANGGGSVTGTSGSPT